MSNRNNGFWDSSMRAGVIAAVISVIFSAITNFYFVEKNNNQQTVKNAILLYSDLGLSLRNISYSLNAINPKAYHEYLSGRRQFEKVSMNPEVLKTPISNLTTNYFIYLNEVKQDITNKDYQNLTNFYDMITTLEKMRIDYISDLETNKDSTKRYKILAQYYQGLLKVHSVYLDNVSGTQDTFENLRNLSKLDRFNPNKL